MTLMNVQKLTTILVVDSIEESLPPWEKLGYKMTVRVPERRARGLRHPHEQSRRAHASNAGKRCR